MYVLHNNIHGVPTWLTDTFVRGVREVVTTHAVAPTRFMLLADIDVLTARAEAPPGALAHVMAVNAVTHTAVQTLILQARVV